MKSIKRLSLLLLAAVMACSLGACRMVSVNEQKDSNTVIAKISGENILKEGYTKYFNMSRLVNTLYGYSTATTEEETEQLKQNTFDEYIINLCLQKECEEKGIADTEDSAGAAYDSIIKYMTTMYAGAEADMSAVKENEDFTALTEEYGLNKDTFESDLENYLTLSSYYSLYISPDAEHSFITEAVAATVNGKDITMQTFNYYLIYTLIYNYMYTGATPSAEEDMLKLYDDTLTFIANAVQVTDYAEKQGYSVTDEEKAAALKSWLNEAFAYFDDMTLAQLYESYYLSGEDVTQAQQLIAASKAYETKLTEGFASEMKVKKSDVKKYYESNSAVYGETISAQHILCKNATTAQVLYERTKGTPEGFAETFAAYQNGTLVNEQILQATDLGAFNYARMVEDFSKAAFAMQPGEVSEPVATQYGYHIIYVYGKTEAMSLDDNYDEIAASYKLSAQNEYAAEQLAKTQKKASVKKKDYRMLPEDRLKDYLYDKYGVKAYPKKALR